MISCAHHIRKRMYIFIATCALLRGVSLEKLNIAGIDMLPNGAVLVVYSFVKNFVRVRLVLFVGFCWRLAKFCKPPFSFSQVNNLIMCDRMRGQTPSFES